MAVILPAAIGVAGGIYKAYQGYQDTKQAKALANTPRPQYQIPGTEYSAYNLLQNRASDGLSASTKQMYLDNADRGMSTSISAVLQGGGNPNDISKLYDSYLGNMSNVALANDKQHIANIDNAINSDYRMSGYLDKQWNTNVFAPWADKQTKAAQLLALGKGETNAGISSITSGLMSGVKGLTDNSDVSGIGKGGGNGSGGGPLGSPGSGGTGLDGLGGPVGGANGPSSFVGPGSGNSGLDGLGGPVGGANGPSSFAGPGSGNPVSPNTPPGAGTPFYGLDVSKMNPNDALMFNKLLFGQG